jgi:hypothetical protein
VVRGACRAGTIDFGPVLAALVGPVKTFFPHCILFQFICPIAQKTGQAAVQGRLSHSMCLWVRHR